MAHACSAHVDQEGVLNALELELQALVSCPVWVLGINPARATSALNHFHLLISILPFRRISFSSSFIYSATLTTLWKTESDPWLSQAAQ